METSPPTYEIRVAGHLSLQWMEWFEGLTIILEEDGNTLLTGPIADQAALHGLLKKVRDTGVPLISVKRVPFNETHTIRSKKGKNEYKHKPYKKDRHKNPALDPMDRGHN